ncbi:MAG TPA: hypothetical protein VF589_03125, partial [Allosphingosinicella sp.]
LTAGYDRRAAEWSGVVGGLDEGGDADLAWALLALASPDPSVDVGTGRIGAYAGRDDSDGKLRSKMLAAGLAGLGRLDPDSAADVGVNTAAANAWTRQLDRAVQDRQPGSVALLAAIGMQTGGWAGVPPEHLYHIVSALRRVGLEYEARMIAAEAVARL